MTSPPNGWPISLLALQPMAAPLQSLLLRWAWLDGLPAKPVPLRGQL